MAFADRQGLQTHNHDKSVMCDPNLKQNKVMDTVERVMLNEYFGMDIV